MMLRGLPFLTASILPGLILFAGCDQLDPADDGPETPVDRTRVVTVIKPTEKTLSQTTTQPATVHAFQQAEVHAKVSGYVSEMKVDIGQKVGPKSVLAVLAVPEMEKAKESQAAEVKRLEANEGRFQAEVELAIAQEKAAKAMLAQMKSQVEKAVALLKADAAEKERVAGLVADMSLASRLLDEAVKRLESSQAAKSAADSAFVSAEAEVEVAAKKIVVARKNYEAAGQQTEVAKKKLAELTELMKYATLTPRFDGVITERNIDVGDLVRNVQTAGDKPRKPLFVISDLSKVRVHVAVPELDAPLVRDGAKAVVSLSAFPGRKFEKTVTRVANRLDPQTRSMLVEIEIDNPKRELLPGMYGEVQITLSRKPQALVLPVEAVRFSSTGKATIYVLNGDDTVRIVPVKTGMDFGDQIEITDGLQPDDRIVGPLIGTLSEKQKVRVNSGKPKGESR